MRKISSLGEWDEDEDGVVFVVSRCWAWGGECGVSRPGRSTSCERTTWDAGEVSSWCTYSSIGG